MRFGLKLIVAVAVLSVGGIGQTQRRAVTPAERAAAEAALARFTSPTLTRFSGETEFATYVQTVRVAALARRNWRAGTRSIEFASAQSVGQSDTTQPLCPENDLECMPAAEAMDRSIVVTGSSIPPSNPSITNNQMRGVEEGDIVKQIGQFLLVLQDGRVFVIDTRAGGGRGLALADRVNVYRNPQSGIWYDEMLVFGDRVLITGYDYEEGETELAVLRLGADGRLTREGIFHISSNDYYSGSNYATRLIDGNLITYTPIDVGDMARAGYRWPVVRRWRPEDDAGSRSERRARRDPTRALPGRPLLDAANIYRPVRASYAPTIHTVSVCPLGETGPGRDLACRTTAMVGPGDVQWYVTGSDVFLWTAAGHDDLRRSGDCAQGVDPALSETVPAVLYRVPLSGAAPTVAGSRGMPPDQFAMQSDGTRFYALVRRGSATCYPRYDDPARLSFFSLDLARLGATLAESPESAFTPLPSVSGRTVASRFTDRHLVYGGLSGYRRGLPDLTDYDADDARRLRALPRQPAYALPIGRPSEVRPLQIGHTVIRAERVGDDIVLTGYRDRRGLRVSLIELDRGPRIGASLLLDGRYESEGRSHAFNSLIERNGGGLMGLPTVPRISDSDRAYWRSRASDLSFIEMSPGGELGHVGELLRRFDYSDDENDEDGVTGYVCEVSCIDWYGNSRPIFTDGRIFALTGTELIEGRLRGGRIGEVQRLNIALTPPRRP